MTANPSEQPAMEPEYVILRQCQTCRSYTATGNGSGDCKLWGGEQEDRGTCFRYISVSSNVEELQ